MFPSAMGIQQEYSRRIVERCNRLGVNVVASGPLFTGGLDAIQNVDSLVLAPTRKPHNTSRNEARSL